MATLFKKVLLATANLLDRLLLSDLRIQRLFQFGFCLARFLSARSKPHERHKTANTPLSTI
jgi:hypothetical protein